MPLNYERTDLTGAYEDGYNKGWNDAIAKLSKEYKRLKNELKKPHAKQSGNQKQG